MNLSLSSFVPTEENIRIALSFTPPSSEDDTSIEEGDRCIRCGRTPCAAMGKASKLALLVEESKKLGLPDKRRRDWCYENVCQFIRVHPSSCVIRKIRKLFGRVNDYDY